MMKNCVQRHQAEEGTDQHSNGGTLRRPKNSPPQPPQRRAEQRAMALQTDVEPNRDIGLQVDVVAVLGQDLFDPGQPQHLGQSDHSNRLAKQSALVQLRDFRDNN